LDRRGHHDDRWSAALELAEQPGSRDPVDPRHPDIHQDDVGMRAPRLRDRRRPVVRLADHGDVRFGLKDRPQATTDEWLVVNQ
jgi:hypothetical protein